MGDHNHPSRNCYSYHGCRCDDCRLAARDYQNAWNRANPEKMRAKRKRCYDANPAKHRARAAAWAKANPAKRAVYNARAYAKNPERTKIASRAWVKANPERARARALVSQHNRRARYFAAEGRLTPEARELLFETYGKACLRCGSADDIVVDHVVALSRGGSNLFENLQPLCRSCNVSKGNRNSTDYRIKMRTTEH
jgi:5-methylcytosine-specific restriction endonuclease McrA